VGEPLRVGLLGAGNISRQYLAALPRLSNLRLVAVADALATNADAVSASQGVPVRTVDELLTSDDVDVILNLTTPQAHASLTIAALEAGKHVYLEKPFATSLAEADAMVAAAQAADRRLGTAPDTVLGTGTQTARALIDRGDIGQPVAATAFMMSAGHESWHPNPGFYYAVGGGPLLDMGPYYVTSLVTMLGPIESVSAMSVSPNEVRVAPEGAPRAGETFPVEVATTVSTLMRHANGAVSTLVVSFDVVASALPRIEVYGTEGSISVPDPNTFDGEVGLGRTRTFEPVENLAGYRGAGRGYGLSDLARAHQAGAPHRASLELGYHVYEVLERILESAATGAVTPVRSRCERPQPVPLGDDPATA
jgi:predicted dehydrogenase